MLSSSQFIKLGVTLLLQIILATNATMVLADDSVPTQPAIAILPLKDQADRSIGDQNDSVYQRVTQAFLGIKKFAVIERNQIDSILGEGRFQGSGIVDEGSAVEMGKQAGAKYVILGSYNGQMTRETSSYRDDKTGEVYNSETYPAKMSINLRMVDVQTGKIENSFTVQVAAKEGNAVASLSELMADLSKKMNRTISNAYPLSGYVIKVISEKESLIDLGTADGVVSGDKFSIIERGEDVIHPVTGKVLKGEKKVVATATVKTVDDNTSVVKISDSEKKVSIGMILESKPKKKGFMESLNDFAK